MKTNEEVLKDLRVEYEELTFKIYGLSIYIGTSECQEEQFHNVWILKEQLRHMREYGNTLVERMLLLTYEQ